MERPVPLMLKIKEAAAIACIDRKSLWRLIDEGKGPPVHVFGGNRRMMRIHREAFQKWLASQVEDKCSA